MLTLSVTPVSPIRSLLGVKVAEVMVSAVNVFIWAVLYVALVAVLFVSLACTLEITWVDDGFLNPLIVKEEVVAPPVTDIVIATELAVMVQAVTPMEEIV